jgi:hypothetical protein
VCGRRPADRLVVQPDPRERPPPVAVRQDAAHVHHRPPQCRQFVPQLGAVDVRDHPHGLETAEQLGAAVFGGDGGKHPLQPVRRVLFDPAQDTAAVGEAVAEHEADAERAA